MAGPLIRVLVYRSGNPVDQIAAITDDAVLVQGCFGCEAVRRRVEVLEQQIAKPAAPAGCSSGQPHALDQSDHYATRKGQGAKPAISAGVPISGARVASPSARLLLDSCGKASWASTMI